MSRKPIAPRRPLSRLLDDGEEAAREMERDGYYFLLAIGALALIAAIAILAMSPPRGGANESAWWYDASRPRDARPDQWAFAYGRGNCDFGCHGSDASNGDGGRVTFPDGHTCVVPAGWMAREACGAELPVVFVNGPWDISNFNFHGGAEMGIYTRLEIPR